nr:MAG TPA: hypothetical protein [Caudoviricetes sp.]
MSSWFIHSFLFTFLLYHRSRKSTNNTKKIKNVFFFEKSVDKRERLVYTKIVPERERIKMNGRRSII